MVSPRRDFQSQQGDVSIDLAHGGIEGLGIGIEVRRESACGLARDVADLGAVGKATTSMRRWVPLGESL